MKIVIDIPKEEYDALKEGRSVFVAAQRGGGKTLTIDLIKAVLKSSRTSGCISALMDSERSAGRTMFPPAAIR